MLFQWKSRSFHKFVEKTLFSVVFFNQFNSKRLFELAEHFLASLLLMSSQCIVWNGN